MAKKKKEKPTCADCGRELSDEEVAAEMDVCEDCDDGGEAHGMEYGDEQWE